MKKGRKKEYNRLETAYKIDSFDLMDNNDYMLMCSNNYYTELLSFERLELTDQGENIALYFKDRFIQRAEIRRKNTQLFFVCPECAKTYQYLYLDKEKKIFVCRKCAKLHYSIQQETKDCFWYFDKAKELAELYLHYSFDGVVPADLPNITPPKPEQMSAKLYDQIIKKYKSYQQKYYDQYIKDALKIIDQAKRGGKDGLF